jgi:dienelactone hydrolase
MPRRFFVLIAIAVLLAGCAAIGEGEHRVTVPHLQAGPTNPALPGWLYKPEGPGPFPAVVMLHGCSGLTDVQWSAMRDYARRFNQRGYAALILDSFDVRNVRNKCNTSRDMMWPEVRVWDAFSAAAFLAKRDDIARDKIVLEGLSHGGWTLLFALDQDRWKPPSRFAAGIAWYPFCEKETKWVSVPVLILTGDADRIAAPYSLCVEELAAMKSSPMLAKRAEDVWLRVYPGATHGFDLGYTGPSNWGDANAYDAVATADAWKQIDAFLARYVQ